SAVIVLPRFISKLLFAASPVWCRPLVLPPVSRVARASATVASVRGRILHNFPDVKRLRRYCGSGPTYDNLIPLLMTFPEADGDLNVRRKGWACPITKRYSTPLRATLATSVTWTGARYGRAIPKEPSGRTLWSSSAILSSCARSCRRWTIGGSS